MAIPATELETLRDALIRARAQGLRSIMYDGHRTEYATDADLGADFEAAADAATTAKIRLNGTV